MSEKVALFPGSFDPFTLGHYSVVQRALGMFDRVIIAVGVNGDKAKGMFTPEQRCDIIRSSFRDEPRVVVDTYTGLTVNYARSCGATCMLRGVRSVQDFEMERNLADINRSLCRLETVLLYTLPEHSFISGSVIRELLRYHHDVSQYLAPGAVLPETK